MRMSWRTIVVAGLFLGLASGGAAAANWSVGFGQGTLEAGVTGGQGTALYVSCSAGTDAPKASLFFVAAADLQGKVGEAYQVDFVVDDKTLSLVMGLEQSTLLGFDGGDPATFAALDSLTRLLRAGKALTVTSDQLKWQESFPLKGSGKALDGIFEGCEPAS